jgi:hypothetical protein
MAADRVRDECEYQFVTHSGDCCGFARAVAAPLGVPLLGNADQIVDTLRTGQGWTLLPNGVVAARRAKAGKLIIGGLKGAEQAQPSPHGHVVVVIDGPLVRNLYPTAYWGRLGGAGAKYKTTNWAWTAEDCDRVSYAEHDIPSSDAGA